MTEQPVSCACCGEVPKTEVDACGILRVVTSESACPIHFASDWSYVEDYNRLMTFLLAQRRKDFEAGESNVQIRDYRQNINCYYKTFDDYRKEGGK